MLLRGDFQPGERLSELPLVARLGVSRTPIRLALDRLANEGLLEVFPTGGFVVRAFTLTDVYDAIEMRGVLEGRRPGWRRRGCRTRRNSRVCARLSRRWGR